MENDKLRFSFTTDYRECHELLQTAIESFREFAAPILQSQCLAALLRTMSVIPPQTILSAEQETTVWSAIPEAPTRQLQASPGPHRI